MSGREPAFLHPKALAMQGFAKKRSPAAGDAYAVVNHSGIRPLIAVDRNQSGHSLLTSTKRGMLMIKLLSALVAAVFAVASVAPAFAQEKKGEEKAMEKKDGKADKKKSDKKDEKKDEKK
jgi:hypothetical protein